MIDDCCNECVYVFDCSRSPRSMSSGEDDELRREIQTGSR